MNNNDSPSWKFWSWLNRDGDPTQGTHRYALSHRPSGLVVQAFDTSYNSSIPNPSESPHQPQAQPPSTASDGTQDASSKEKDVFLPAAETSNPSLDKSSMGLQTNVQHESLADPGPADTPTPLEMSVEDPDPPSVHLHPTIEPDNEKQDTLGGNTLTSEAEPAFPQRVLEAAGPSQEVRKRWNGLAASVDSFVSDLVSAGDLRRLASEQKRAALQKLDDVLPLTENPALQDLRSSLSELLDTEEKLQESDDSLVVQGDSIRAQGTRIFGPAAQSSFEVLSKDSGFLDIQEDTETEGSVAFSDDGLGQTLEGKQYLSKKGDVDLLRETLINIAGELGMIIGREKLLADDVDSVEALRVQRQEVTDQLQKAEEELDDLRDKLPDREVDIRSEQLRSPTEEREEISFYPDLPEQDAEAASRLLPGLHRPRLDRILENATQTKGEPVKPKILAEAYLLYQLRWLPEEQEHFLKILNQVMQEADQSLEATPSLLPLHPWFEKNPASRSSRTQTGDLISQAHSNATDSHQSLLTPLSAPREAQQLQFDTGDDARRLSLFAEYQKLDRLSLP